MILTGKNLIETVEYAMLHGQKIFITGNLEDNKDDKAEEKLRRIGTVCEIKQIMKLQGNVLRILVRGLNRGNSLAYNMDDRIMLANVDISDDMEEHADELILTAHARDIKELVRLYAAANPKLNKEAIGRIMAADSLEEVLYRTLAELPLGRMAKSWKFMSAAVCRSAAYRPSLR